MAKFVVRQHSVGETYELDYYDAPEPRSSEYSARIVYWVEVRDGISLSDVIALYKTWSQKGTSI